MSSPAEFQRMVAVLAEFAGNSDLVGVEIDRPEEDSLRVSVTTREPGRWIGRRGATAEAIRDALIVRFGVPNVQVDIREPQVEPPPPRWPPY